MEDIVTIDGPTSSGKNSVGFLLAQKLGYKFIDSGMLYRAGCYKILKENIEKETSLTKKSFTERSAIKIFKKHRGLILIIHGSDDTTIPITQAHMLYKTLRNKKISTKLEVIPKLKHVLPLEMVKIILKRYI